MAKTAKTSNTEVTKSPYHNVLKVLKADSEINVGFSSINRWASTGIYALNRLLSNSYFKSFHYGRTITVYGEPGSGKTLMFALTAAREQRVNGTYIVWVDVETATDNQVGRDWFEMAGVDTSEDKFSRINLATYGKALKQIALFVNDYKSRSANGEILPPIMFVFDSFSTLQSDTNIEQNEGKKPLTGDQGQLAKQLGNLILRFNSMISNTEIIIAGVLHVQMSQDEYGPRHKTTGGLKALYMASQALMLTKFELTNEKAEAHNRLSNSPDDKKKNIGIRSKASILKSRFSKPFENVVLEIIYPRGIDPYSGLMDLMIEDEIITSPSQGWYQFTRTDGTIQKFRRANFLTYADEMMTLPIPEYKAGVIADPEKIKSELALEGDIDVDEDDLKFKDSILDEVLS
jgi:RecA/RadA recombinase